jgi:hypothetical protein
MIKVEVTSWKNFFRYRSLFLNQVLWILSIVK